MADRVTPHATQPLSLRLGGTYVGGEGDYTEAREIVAISKTHVWYRVIAGPRGYSTRTHECTSGRFLKWARTAVYTHEGYDAP